MLVPSATITVAGIAFECPRSLSNVDVNAFSCVFRCGPVGFWDIAPLGRSVQRFRISRNVVMHVHGHSVGVERSCFVFVCTTSDVIVIGMYVQYERIELRQFRAK